MANKTEMYIHLVWGTFERRPLLSPEREALVFRCIASEARKLGCEVLALNGMPDHVHLAVRFPTTVSVACLLKRVKGISSALLRDQLGKEAFFQWEPGYGAFTFGKADCDAVVAYINHQKTHHARQTVREEIEESTAAWQDEERLATGSPG